MGINDVGIIGVGKDEFNGTLDGMINGRTISWVEDIEDDGYPVWQDYDAVQRSTYFLDREGNLLYQFNLTTLDPDDPEDYSFFINMILDYRSNNGPGVIRVKDDYVTIQAAIENADNGDIILVEPGTYLENIDFLDKNITVASLLFSGYEDYSPDQTIIDGDNQGSVVTINNGQNQSTILLGFNIQNGNSAEFGGGILIEDSSPTIDRNIIQNNYAGSCGGAGGGIAIIGDSYPYIFGNKISNNTTSGDCDCDCYFGGGIYVDSSSWPILGGSVTLGNIIFGNISDNGKQLYRDYGGDTTSWTPIYAHHNYFQFCPPDLADVYPLNGWDLENCHTISELKINDSILNVEEFVLYPNYPNPFNPITNIKFDLIVSSNVSIEIFNVRGENIYSDMSKLTPGNYLREWNGKGFPSGIYFINVKIGKSSFTQKALLVK